MGRKVQNLFAVFVSCFLVFSCAYIKQKPVPLEEKLAQPLHTPLWKYQGWVIARGSVHNHTIYSDGCRTPEDLIQQARNEGIAVLAITDHREGRICIKGNSCLDLGGVDSPKRGGYEKYLAHLQKLAKQSQMPILIYGVEVAPYFWNARSLPWALIKGQGWHFTIYGIDELEVYENMLARKEISAISEPAPGIEPYQRFVDYIWEKGGLVFQAHPESSSNDWILTIHTWEPAPTHLTARLPHLTGVAVIPEGFFQVGAPGGEWDQALFQYLAGFREAPLWAWGEADYHCPPTTLRRGTTLFYLKEFSREEVFNAIREGRMVALMGEDFQEVFVSEFSVSDRAKPKERIMLGEEIELSGPARVRFSLNKEVPIKEARLIRNGKVIYTTSSSHFEYLDRQAFEKKLDCYYRVQVLGKGELKYAQGNLLFTNPIFVRFK